VLVGGCVGDGRGDAFTDPALGGTWIDALFGHDDQSRGERQAHRDRCQEHGRRQCSTCAVVVRAFVPTARPTFTAATTCHGPVTSVGWGKCGTTLRTEGGRAGMRYGDVRRHEGEWGSRVCGAPWGVRVEQMWKKGNLCCQRGCSPQARDGGAARMRGWSPGSATMGV